MISFRRAKTGIAVFLAAYFIGGMSLHYLKMPREEIIPLFSWYLYTPIGRAAKFYNIKVREYGGRAYPVPLDVEVFVVQKYESVWVARWLAQRIGMAHAQSRYLERDAFRNLLENAIGRDRMVYDLYEYTCTGLSTEKDSQGKKIAEFSGGIPAAERPR